MEPGTTETRHSLCETCRGPISISIVVGEQRWDDVAWKHDVTDPNPPGHVVFPEMRFLIDATCPGCDYPEIGFAPLREEFVCSRCKWTGTERPVA